MKCGLDSRDALPCPAAGCRPHDAARLALGACVFAGTRRAGTGAAAGFVAESRGRAAQGHHAHHVARRRLPPRGREGAAGAAHRGRHPHPGSTLLVLRRHPRHHDDVLRRDEGGEQRHPHMGNSDKVHPASVRVPDRPGLPQEDGGGNQEAGTVWWEVATDNDFSRRHVYQ